MDQSPPSEPQQSQPIPPTPPPPQSPLQSQNTLMAVLAYLGILIIVPFLTAKNDPFVKFHIKQGLALIVLEVIGWMSFALPLGGMLGFAIHIASIVFIVLGIMNALAGKMQELPLIGGFANSFNI